ncbi:unnamed protein product [Schistosoma mattheei]|uniref:Uncharacterized protein n=1 Tax=Schistosoma mattheei TaxID=31246 RepID=A0A3P8GJZ5_9TREM|nr:unnamed protein product [Schistosoma mattheei]
MRTEMSEDLFGQETVDEVTTCAVVQHVRGATKYDPESESSLLDLILAHYKDDIMSLDYMPSLVVNNDHVSARRKPNLEHIMHSALSVDWTIGPESPTKTIYESPGPSESFSTELLAQSALDKYSDQSDYSFSDDSNQYSSLLSCHIPCYTQQRTVRDSDDHKSKLITRKECSGASNVLLSHCPSSRSNLARNRFERTASLKRTPVFYEKHTDDGEKRRSGSCNFVSVSHKEVLEIFSSSDRAIFCLRLHLFDVFTQVL